MKRVIDALAGRLAVLMLRSLKRTDPERLAAFAAAVMRRVGAWLPEQRVGGANLAAAFPEKTEAARAAILREVWANMGRLGAEYVHLDTLWDAEAALRGEGRFEIDAATREILAEVRDDGLPALFFTAHTGSWEFLGPMMATFGLRTIVLYRPPNNAEVDASIRALRASKSSEVLATTRDAVPKILRALAAGRHVGMVVDQHFGNGADITFFGRPCKANATLARLARRIDCPIYGSRVIRLPGYRFRIEAVRFDAARDADGRIDVAATTQKINDVVESWVREFPDQWLWLHRRWR